MQKDWSRVLREEIRRAPVVDGNDLNLKDPQGGEWDEWPADLQTREMPSGFHSLRFAAMH